MNLEKGHGKRFALKDRNSGKIKDAYGFDLSPLLARKHEFAAAVAAQERSRHELEARKYVLDERRRDLKNLRDGFAKLNLPDLQEQADRAAASALTPRSNKTTIEDVNQLLLAAESARERLQQAYLEAFEAGERGKDAEENILCGGKFCPHSYNNTDTNFTESCSEQTRESENSGLGGGRKDETIKTLVEENSEPKKFERGHSRNPAPQVLDPFLWHQACPALESYTRRPSLAEVLEAGRLMSSMLGISKRGIDHCYRTLGQVLFPLLCVYVHQLYADDQERDRPTLRNPGGLVVSMAKEIASGQRDLSADLVALSEKRLHQKYASPNLARKEHSPRELEERLNAVPARPLRQIRDWSVNIFPPA